nr:hypothetical protein [Lagierella sp.]
MNRFQNRRTLLNIILTIAIIGIVFLIFFNPMKKDTDRNVLRIGVGDDLAGALIKKVLKEKKFNFDVEPYYIQDC